MNLKNIEIYSLFNFSENHLIALGVTNKQENKYFNSLVILNNKLEILSIYNKINLVPFGEFLPFEKILSKLGLKKVTWGYNSFSAGEDNNSKLLAKDSNLNILSLISSVFQFSL